MGKETNKYFISYEVDVIKDSYENGQELSNCNSYAGEGFITATNVQDAIKKFFNEELCFNIYFEHMELLQDDNLSRYCYSVLCDSENCELSETDQQFKDWKDGKIEYLYSNDINFNIYKLEEIKDLTVK